MLIEADPDTGDEIGRIANGPGIAEVLGGTGFDSQLVARNGEGGDAAGAVGGEFGLVVGEDVTDDVGILRIDDAAGRMIGSEYFVTRSIIDLENRRRLNISAGVGHDTVGAGQLK